MSGFLGGILDAIGINTTPRGMLDAPVGTSTMQRVTNASPDFSPMISPGLLSNEQRLGAFWNLATRRAKPWTNRDLPQLSEAANEAYDAAGGFVGMSTPIRAYHGSPHTFDRFDLSKIGTGEGAQAYGHGLYFAGNEDVARGYRQALERRNIAATWEGKPIENWPALVQSVGEKDWRVGKLLGEYGRLGGNFDDWMRQAGDWYRSDKSMMNALDEVARKIKAEHTPGSMYEVSLRTSPERLLDWDKPLIAAPNKPLLNALEQTPQGVFRPDEQTASGAYWTLAERLRGKGNPEGVGLQAANSALRDAGIDGIQYLDAGSRAAGDGSRNYVMFRDDIIDILKRYGLLGMIGGGAAATVGAPEQ